MRFDPLLGQDVEEEVERLFYTAAPARFVHIALLKGLNSSSVPGRLAASSLLLGAGAAALLGRLGPPWTSCCSTQLQGSTQLMIIINTKGSIRSWQSMDLRLPQATAYTSAAGEN